MHAGSLTLLLLAAATVAVVHSVLPDHWVPLAVVGRAQHWSLVRVGRISALAAGGHVIASLLLAGIVAVVGLRFQDLIDRQQGHLIGGVLVLTGLGFLIWGLTGHGHEHGHEHGPGGGHGDADPDHRSGPDAHDEHDHDEHDHDEHDHDPHEHDSHEHGHDAPPAAAEPHEHEHAHEQVVHSHPHSHEAYIHRQGQRLLEHSQTATLAGRLATIAVPFGIAASPDLTILPIALGASAYGRAAVFSVLAIFGVVTMATFVGLTVAATAAGYQMRGEWIEKNANTITSVVLIAIGVVAYLGF